MNMKLLPIGSSLAALSLLVAAGQVTAGPRGFSNNPPPQKFEPRSYSEFVGVDPHPDWQDGAENAIAGISAIDPELPLVRLVVQQNENLTPGSPTPCSNYFGNSPTTIMTTKVTPGSNIMSVEASLQPSLPEGPGFAGIALICTVTQGANVYACSGTKGEPIMVQRIKQSQSSPVSAWRSSNVALSSYHGYVDKLNVGEEATVTIAARTFSSPAGVLGQVCYGSMAVNYDAGNP